MTRGGMVPGMAYVRRLLCRYKCGECDYERKDRWSVHQKHYESHRVA